MHAGNNAMGGRSLKKESDACIFRRRSKFALLRGLLVCEKDVMRVTPEAAVEKGQNRSIEPIKPQLPLWHSPKSMAAVDQLCEEMREDFCILSMAPSKMACCHRGLEY